MATQVAVCLLSRLCFLNLTRRTFVITLIFLYFLLCLFLSFYRSLGSILISMWHPVARFTLDVASRSSSGHRLTRSDPRSH